MKERKGKSTPAEMNSSYLSYVIEAQIKGALTEALGRPVDITVTEAPPQFDADYGVQVSPLAKILGKNPQELSSELALRINASRGTLFEGAFTAGPYLNIRLEMAKVGTDIVDQVLRGGSDFGRENLGHGDRVVIDMSSPNIAKRMSYGHLRSTIIGDAIANIYRNLGYEVIRDNHIGDWGTQFGNLIVALKEWGDENELGKSSDPIGYLQDLYVKFHTEAEEEKGRIRDGLKRKIKNGGVTAVSGLSAAIKEVGDEIVHRKKIATDQLDGEKVFEDALDRVVKSELEEHGRNWFLKLEQGDPEARRIWKLCVDLSIMEFQKLYDVLGVDFELTLGESFYEDKLQGVIREVRKSKASKTSQGALIIDMSDKNLGVSLIQKSDGASLYVTRDLACAIDREGRLKAKRAVYVVGDDQRLYFQQLFEILRRLGHPIGENCSHVYFGMVRLPEGKMSTRKGRTILLKDVIEEGFDRVEKLLEERKSGIAADPTRKDKIVRQIAVGALKWNDLSQDPKRSIVFDWDKALNLEGNSAPYVQYAAVRANKILELGGVTKNKVLELGTEVSTNLVYKERAERSLIRYLAEYPKVLKAALDEHNPSNVATYVYELAKRFNTFYAGTPVLKVENTEIRNARLRLVVASSQVITNALATLGIEVPEEM